MGKSVYNQNDVDFMTQPMFFGEDQNVQRFDQQKYPIFEKLTEKQLGFFWRPQEVSLQKDRDDYQNLTDAQKFIFTSNLKYQTLLDSVQGRGPFIALLPYASLPELEACIVQWGAMEEIHSRSYTYLMKNVYANPTEVLDTIIGDEQIKARAESVTKYYDDFIEYGMRWQLGDPECQDEYELKRRFYLMLLSINILEGIRFYASFSCTFAFAENKLMEGSAKIMSLIARDESQHLAVTQNIIKNYQRYEDDPVMLEVMKNTTDDVYAMYDQTVQEEKRWADYLFSKGSMLGMNAEILHQYIEYMANKRMVSIGLDAVYDQPVNKNPLPWMNNWIGSGSNNVQVAPQETEVESYIVGGVDSNYDTNTFTNYEL